jgi:hypothetical protein
MRRIIRAGLALALLGIVLVLAGCSSQSADAGMKVWGYVVAEKNAVLELAESQPGVTELTVDRVLAPGGAWVVVHADDNGKPGERVGLAHVDKGESNDVKVSLKGVTTDKVIVAVHADKGTAGKFDFDMMNKEASPDRPYFVDESELARVVTVR